MSKVKSWRTLVRLKERRLKDQQQEVQNAREELRQCEAELEEAQERHAQSLASRDEARGLLQAMYCGAEPFSPHRAIMRRHQIEDREAALTQAAHAVEVHTQRVATTTEDLKNAQRILQRMERQLEMYREELEKALQAKEREQEDQQDEDAEETAVARILAASRELPEETRRA